MNPPLLSGLLFTLVFVFSGCAIPPAAPATKSITYAWATPQDTRLGKYFAAAQKRAPGKSGGMLLESGDAAFGTRIALADAAEKTLDVQYYIWRGDSTGKLMLSRLLAAAQRGVRIRLLIDDVGFDTPEFSLAVFDAHPNFEVRIFNPFSLRIGAPFSWVPEYIINSDRVNHRMHNKAFIADSVAAIVGGRNIGDEYFGVAAESNFRDLDLLVVGPVTRDMNAVFDRFWNSPWAVPLKAIAYNVPKPVRADKVRGYLERFEEELQDYPYPHRRDPAATDARLSSIAGSLIWAPMRVIADEPKKVGNPEQQKVGESITDIMRGTRSELLIESAYFIPREDGVALLGDIERSNARVRVLTNSLASSDVALTFAGYAKYRVPLLESGVDLHEFRPLHAPTWKQRKKSKGAGGSGAGSSRVNLHTKAIVVDRQRVFIGTPNFDPRSIVLNTEIGLLVDDKRLATQVAQFIETGLNPTSSWCVSLDDNGDLVWTAQRNGQISREKHDPEAGFVRSLITPFLKLLPIESQL